MIDDHDPTAQGQDHHDHVSDDHHDNGSNDRHHDHGSDDHHHDHGSGHDHHDHGSDDHHHDREEHHQHDEATLSVGVLTVSSSRTLSDDPAGDLIVATCEEAGHTVADRQLVADDRDAIVEAVADLLDDAGADVVVTAGGTGLTPDDVTPEALTPLFDRHLPGFGELFRWLSYEEVGPMAMASRATAGVVDDRLVFCLPGSENAARTGIEQLVVPAAGHLLGLVQR